ncbi:MAG: hypothetical protein QM820_21780 [Minicystis sp.]
MAADPVRAGALSIECRSVAVHRPALARQLSRLAAAVMLAPAILGASSIFLHLLGSYVDLWHPIVDGLFWPWLVITTGLAVASARVGARGQARAGRLDLDGDGVRVTWGNRAWAIPADEVAAGLVLPTTTGPALDLHLGDGSVLRAGVEAEDEAHAVLDRLGVGPDRRRVAVALGSEAWPLIAGCLAFPAAVALGIVGLMAIAGLDARSDVWLLLWALLPVLATLVARSVAAPPEVVIGADGVVLRRAAWSRHVPFSAIERVSGDAAVLMLVLRDPEGLERGERIALRGNDGAITVALADRIAGALSSARRDASTAVAAQLDPEGLSFDAWLAALDKLLRGGTDYRRAAVAADDLLAVVEDASAPPAIRVGAALALRAGDSPEGRARVRIAADACADDEVRAALEAAAEEELNEAPIRRWMEAGRRDA